MNTIQEIVAALPEAARAQAMQTITAAVETERQKGIQASQEANKEAEGLRKRFKMPLKEILGTDEVPDNWHEQVKGWKEGISKMSEKDKALMSQSTELKDFMDRFAKMENELKGEKDKAEKLRIEKVNGAISSKLMEKLAGEVYNAPMVIKGLMADKIVGYDEEKNDVYFTKGNDRLGLDDGLKQMFESGSLERKVTQKQGAGGSGNGGADMSKEAEIRNMLVGIGALPQK